MGEEETKYYVFVNSKTVKSQMLHFKTATPFYYNQD